MDQARLRQLEAQCIQEEQPRCQAACPLHVDARGLCNLLREERINEAWAILCRTMPLPGVLARICDGPCKGACLRCEAGGGVAVNDLERFCAKHATRTPPLRPMPARNKTLAVLGAGMAGLTAAWDLGRKGFNVTLYCRHPGAGLLARYGDRLTATVLERELAALGNLGVALCDGPAPDAALLEQARTKFEAVFVDLEDCPALAEVVGAVDPDTLGAVAPGLFAASADVISPVLRAAQGRRAVLSMERHLQGASMTASREREGPSATRLFTSLEGVRHIPPTPAPAEGYDARQAREEAARCLDCQCLECVLHCAYLEHYKGYPKTYARQIYNNASIVMGTRHANRMINSCMLCDLCEVICPEDFSMAELCLEARRDMVRKGRMPPSAHEFALRDMAFANGGHCSLVRNAPGTAASAFAFFPGCQLTASDPGAVKRAYAHLRAVLPGDAGLMLSCCGAPADWSGQEILFAESMERLRAHWKDLGQPVLVTACPTCQEQLHEHLPEAELRSLWNVLLEHGLPPLTQPGSTLALHDPCTARHDNALRQDVRNLLAILGVELKEPEMSGELTECCGFGGLLSEANPPLADTVIRRRAQSMDEDFVTYCAMCRDRLARTGKPALHLVDLLFPAADMVAAGGRPAPGYSERRENRARLKADLLREVWREQPEPDETLAGLEVRYTDQAAQRMEERRILKSDVQKTLLACRQSGRVLAHAASNRLLAHHRPVCVTYWVEYEEHGQAFVVHNVWSHRMQIMEGTK